METRCAGAGCELAGLPPSIEGHSASAVAEQPPSAASATTASKCLIARTMTFSRTINTALGARGGRPHSVRESPMIPMPPKVNASY